MTKTMIWITTSFEGFHYYSDAPKGVDFLTHPHRHIFHVKVSIEVHHDDRELEFILFKRFVDSLLKDGQMNNKSCEMIADTLHDKIDDRYPSRQMTISVSEDNENGALKVYEPAQSPQTTRERTELSIALGVDDIWRTIEDSKQLNK